MNKREWNVTKQLKGKRKAVKRLLSAAFALTAALALPLIPQLPGVVPYVEATEDAGANQNQGAPDNISSNTTNIISRTSDTAITDDDRAEADEDMLYYMQSLEVRYNLDEKVMENLHKVFDSAVYYIANTEMSITELWAFVSQTKSNMESAAVDKVTMTTSEFLQVARAGDI